MLDPDAVVWDDWTLLIVQIATLIGLLVYVWKTWQIADATRRAAEATAAATRESYEARMAAMAPRIMVYFSPEDIRTAELVVENVGAGTARNVVLRFEPDLQTVFASEEATRFATNPKPVIPPGYRLTHTIGSWPEYNKKELPKLYTVRVTYAGAENDVAYETEFVLDTDALHRFSVERKDMHDLVQEVEATRKMVGTALDQIGKSIENQVRQDRFRGIPVRDTWHARAALVATWNMLDSLPENGPTAKWEAAAELLRIDALAAAHAAALGKIPPREREAISLVVSILLERRMLGDRWKERLTEAFDFLRDPEGLRNAPAAQPADAGDGAPAIPSE